MRPLWKRVPWLLAALTVTLGSWVIWRCPAPITCRAALIQDLYDWQTLAAGLIALVGAVIGAWFLHSQNRQTLELENKRRARKRAAVRAVMPLALSGLVDYARKCAAVWKSLIDQCGDDYFLPKTARVPSIPDEPTESITVLSEFIEFSGAGETDLVEEVLREIQIQNARMRAIPADIERNVFGKGPINTGLRDAASVYAQASAMFGFSRGLDDDLPRSVTWDDVRQGLRNMDIWDIDYPDVYAQIDKEAEKSTGPKRFAKE